MIATRFMMFLECLALLRAGLRAPRQRECSGAADDDERQNAEEYGRAAGTSDEQRACEERPDDRTHAPDRNGCADASAASRARVIQRSKRKQNELRADDEDACECTGDGRKNKCRSDCGYERE